MSKALKNWIQNTSAEHQEKVAKIAGTTRNYLFQVAGGHRNLSVEMAANLERATQKLFTTGAMVKVLTRLELSTICAKCPLANQCPNQKG